jgi:hypothetical protein
LTHRLVGDGNTGFWRERRGAFRWPYDFTFRGFVLFFGLASCIALPPRPVRSKDQPRVARRVDDGWMVGRVG